MHFAFTHTLLLACTGTALKRKKRLYDEVDINAFVIRRGRADEVKLEGWEMQTKKKSEKKK